MRRRGALVVALVLVKVLVASAAFGAFSGSGAASHTLASATLEPISGLGVVTSCQVLGSATAVLTWTATPSTWATGYKVERWRGSTLENTATVTPRTTVTLTENGLAKNTTYTWKVYSYFASWTSTVVQITATTPGGLCL